MMGLQIRLLEVCGWNRKGCSAATEIFICISPWFLVQMCLQKPEAGLWCCNTWISGSAGPTLPRLLNRVFFNGSVLCCPVPKNAGLGCVVICDMKSSQSCWWEWWSVMAFHYPSWQTDFLVRVDNSLLPPCPWRVQRCTSVSSTRIHGVGKKDGCYIPVQSFSDKAEFSFWEQGWN